MKELSVEMRYFPCSTAIFKGLAVFFLVSSCFWADIRWVLYELNIKSGGFAGCYVVK